ncbi:glutamate 5-kinase [Isachenkonia alkalipeptolytica]|uniref:Glutamate 5-kinase n=1 Tax=Isachenkonia alkalipeptolytica TaxID=2565777 RepID=A0AA43XHY6_9CLOT|nr:glutamate 5-kinase [Isachenkonia alkalipeptolytica]NBG86932.1 glutamate 5-kinase [Isachenkonia alkalipeptolytica]
MIRQLMENSRKIVIKIGSNTLAKDDGTISRAFLENLGEDVHQLMREGKQVVIVSSGARIAGVSTIGKWMRKEDINYKQALCAIGQVELMDAYRRVFEKHGIHIGQILYTREDFLEGSRSLNIRNTLFTLAEEGVVPIINENDSVCVDEIKIGDNDTLAAYTANIWNADLLIMLSDIDGIYSKNPKTCEDAKLVELVESIDELRKSIEIGCGNLFGTGGIETKIEAARKVGDYKIPMILSNGKVPHIIEKLKKGEAKGTLFDLGGK